MCNVILLSPIFFQSLQYYPVLSNVLPMSNVVVFSPVFYQSLQSYPVLSNLLPISPILSCSLQSFTNLSSLILFSPTTSCEYPVLFSLTLSYTIRAVTRRLIRGGGVHIHIFGYARRISFVESIAYKRNSSGITEYINMHPRIKRLVTALYTILSHSI